MILVQQRMQDDMMDLMDYSSEIQDSLGRSYGVPDDIDEEDLMGGKIISILLSGPRDSAGGGSHLDHDGSVIQ